jgi:hypothetical protein
MCRFRISIVCLGLVALGCDRGLPTAPTPGATAVPLPTPSPSPQPPLGSHIEVGEVITSRVTSDDPLCGHNTPFPCRYYRLTPARDGVLQVTLAWNPQLVDDYPLDMSVIDPQGKDWAATVVGRAQRGVSVRVTAGASYVIEIWSFLSPGVEFELRSSLSVQ